MINFNQLDIQGTEVAAKGKLLEVVQDFHNLQKVDDKYICDCPICHASDKLTIIPKKDIFKCLACKQALGIGAISYLMKVEGMSYIEAMVYLTEKFKVPLRKEKEVKVPVLPNGCNLI